MLTIDANDMMISITRGDYAAIVFSAVDGDENEWHPSEADVDTLTFAVAKKFGEEPVMSISNVYDGDDEEAFWTIEIGKPGSSDWCKKDAAGHVVIGTGGEPELIDFGTYVWDLQLTTSTGVVTIIGKSDEMSPKFRIWGEVAE